MIVNGFRLFVLTDCDDLFVVFDDILLEFDYVLTDFVDFMESLRFLAGEGGGRSKNSCYSFGVKTRSLIFSFKPLVTYCFL